jgi:hypothetical protein
MVSVLASSAVDCGFIGGVMVSVLASSAVDWHANHYTTDEPTIYSTGGEHANH